MAGKTQSPGFHHQHVTVDGGNLFWWFTPFDSPVKKSLLQAPTEALNLSPAKTDNRKEADILCSLPGKTKHWLSLLACRSKRSKPVQGACCPSPSTHPYGFVFPSFECMFFLGLHLPWLAEGKLVPCLFSFCRKAGPASRSPGRQWEEKGPSRWCWTNQTPPL